MNAPPPLLIVGRSVSGLVLAAGLSALGHRVTLKSRSFNPSPKLTNGCTLRRAALVAIADAFGITLDTLVERLGPRATFHTFSTVRGAKTFSSRTAEIGGLSTRHERILEVLFELLPKTVTFEEGDVRFEDLPAGLIVLNATGKSAARPADGYVSAVQLALKAPANTALVSEGHASLVIDERAGMPQVGFFAPFHDPLTPDANAYMFFGMTTNTAATVDDGWRRILAAHHVEPLEATRVDVQLPYSRHKTVELCTDRVIDLSFSPGAPGVALDGMTSQAVGAHAFMRAFGHGGDARRGIEAADHALTPLRKANKTNVWVHSDKGRVLRRALYFFGSNAMLDRMNKDAVQLGMLSHAEIARTGLLTQIGPDIWRMRQVQGAFASHMTVVRAQSGGLIVHSPVKGATERVRALGGAVEHIVAPNLFHHAALGEFRAAFPDARVWIAPGFDKKLPQLAAGATVLAETTPVDPALDQIVFRGHDANETIFFHRASRTLIITDLAYNVGDESAGFERFWFTVFGVRRSGRVPSYNRKLVKDHAAFLASWQRVFDWDFTQVSVAHGRLMRGDVKDALRQQWLPLVI